MMKSRFLRKGFPILLLLSLPAAVESSELQSNQSQEIQIRLPVPEQEVLPNGLRLVWFLSDSLPVVDLALLVKSGYRDDPAGKSGTAALVAASLDRGAGGMNARELAEAVEKLGASRYAGSDDETFTAGMHGLAPDAPKLLKLLAQMTTQPDFSEAEVTREHTRMLDRWKHIGDRGGTLAGLAWHRLIAADTPYGRGGFLSSAEFSKVTREDVINFHKKHFTPKNSVLMVVGRVDRNEFRKKIMEAFGSWQGEAPEPVKKTFSDKRLVRAGKGAAAAPQVVVVNRDGLTQAEVRIGFRAPLVKHPDHHALAVGNALLGEYFNSRLSSRIRDELGLTYSIGSAFSYSRELATFTVSSSTRNEMVGELIQETMKILKSTAASGASAEEVKTAKEYMTGGFPLSVATLGAVASRWLAGYIFDMGPEYLNGFVPKVNAVTPEQVNGAFKRHFKPEQALVIIAGDGKQIGKALKKSGIRYREVGVKDLL